MNPENYTFRKFYTLLKAMKEHEILIHLANKQKLTKDDEEMIQRLFVVKNVEKDDIIKRRRSL
jgi:hypothetical protein